MSSIPIVSGFTMSAVRSGTAWVRVCDGCGRSLGGEVAEREPRGDLKCDCGGFTSWQSIGTIEGGDGGR